MKSCVFFVVVVVVVLDRYFIIRFFFVDLSHERGRLQVIPLRQSVGPQRSWSPLNWPLGWIVWI